MKSLWGSLFQTHQCLRQVGAYYCEGRLLEPNMSYVRRADHLRWDSGERVPTKGDAAVQFLVL